MDFNVDELMELMNLIDYGYVDRDNNKHYKIGNEFSKLYQLQAPGELLKSKLGVCWDQVELERDYFEKHNIECKTFCIAYYDEDMCPTHTFLSYKEGDYHIWLEHSWEKYRGIKSYSSLEDMLLEVKNNFISTELPKIINNDNLCIYEYLKPKYNISCLEFYEHFEKGKNIIIK